MTYLSDIHELKALEGQAANVLGAVKPFFADGQGKPVKVMPFFACFLDLDGRAVVLPCSKKVETGQIINFKVGEWYAEINLKARHPMTGSLVNLDDEADWDAATYWLDLSETGQTSPSEILVQTSS